MTPASLVVPATLIGVLSVALTALTAFPQAPAPGTQSQVRAAAPPSGLVLGQVVDATTNKPIGRAIVTLSGGSAGATPVLFGGPGPQRVLTDADGHFLFRDLAHGTYAFSATAPGYLYGGYGQRRPAGPTQPFVLEDGQRVGDVVLRLWKESVIGGTVTDETGQPVVGITVLINRRVVVNGRAELRIQAYGKRTDDRGVYSQAAIPAGEYVVTVPAGMTAVSPGQAALDAATLRASGADALQGATRGAGVRTGDLVLLRGGLNTLAGQLPLRALPDGRLVTYSTTFHPSSGTLTEAGVISVGVGEERTDVDVRLRPVTTAPLSGTVVAPDGPAVNTAVHLIPAYAAHTPVERTFEAAVTMTDRAGKFVFPAIAAGSYVVETWRMPSRNASLVDSLPAEPSLWAEASIVIDATPATVSLTLRRGAALSGRIVLEGTSKLPQPQQFRSALGAWFEPPWPLAFGGGPLGQTRITANWEFMREGVPPGTYVPNVVSTFRPPAGWYFKSVTLDGRDLVRSPLVLDGQDVSGIVVTFTDRPTTLSGLVTAAAGRPDPDAGVLVFPADFQAWLQNGLPVAAARSVATAQTGAYEFRDLPPGDYLVAALDIDALDDWQQTSVVQALVGQATRVTLASGTATKVDLRRR